MSEATELTQTSEAQLPAATSDSTNALISMIERASTNPEVDVEKLERLWSMYDAERKRQAEQEFNSALGEMQAEMPAIREGGQIKHGQTVISTYGRWDEDILPVVRPILRNHGFGLSFRTETKDSVTVEAVLSHQSGHSERTSITLSPDTSGSKSGPQAVASSVSYGKRYTAASLLNLEIHGQDDDAQSASGPEKIDAEQAANIEALIEEVGADRSRFLQYWKVTKVEDIGKQAYSDVVKSLEKKRGK